MRLAETYKTSRFIILSMITVNRLGSLESQLRVHPTTGLYRFARYVAKELIAAIAVSLEEFLVQKFSNR